MDTAANVFQTNFWKSHFCALGSRPPLLHLDNSRHSVWRCTLVCHPNNCCKWVKVSWFSSRLHGTNCKVFRVWIFNPWRYSVMNGFWVIQIHVGDGNLYMNLLFRIEAVWRENDRFTAGIWPFWHAKFYLVPQEWEACMVYIKINIWLGIGFL